MLAPISEDDFMNMAQTVRTLERASSINAVMLCLLQVATGLEPFDYCVFFLFNENTGKAVRHAIAQAPGQEAPVRELVRLLHDEMPSYFDNDEIQETQDSAAKICEWQVGDDLYQLQGKWVLTACFADGGRLYGALCLCRESAFQEKTKLLLEALEPTVTYKIRAFSSAGHIEAEKRREFNEQFKLSAREIEIAECITSGMNAIDIANKLNISTRTVNKHLEHIYKKTGVNNRLSLMRFIQIYLRE